MGWHYREVRLGEIQARWRAEIAKETPERLLRFLTTWPDVVLQEDWRSALGGGGDDLGLAYLKLRRKAPGWNPRHMSNNHSQIAPADVEALLSTGVEGGSKMCEVCHGRFRAKHRDARFCSQVCKKRSWRAGRSGLVPESLTNMQVSGG